MNTPAPWLSTTSYPEAPGNPCRSCRTDRGGTVSNLGGAHLDFPLHISNTSAPAIFTVLSNSIPRPAYDQKSRANVFHDRPPSGHSTTNGATNGARHRRSGHHRIRKAAPHSSTGVPLAHQHTSHPTAKGQGHAYGLVFAIPFCRFSSFTPEGRFNIGLDVCS
jgi:hypothetical protein